MKKSKLIHIIFYLACWAAPLRAAPPPPIPSWAPDVIGRLEKTLESKDIAAYAGLFTSDVKVFENDKLVGEGISHVKLLAQNWIDRSLSFKPIYIAEGGDQYFVLEAVDNYKRIKPSPGGTADCCVWSRALFLIINNDYKVKQISIRDMDRATFYRSPPR